MTLRQRLARALAQAIDPESCVPPRRGVFISAQVMPSAETYVTLWVNGRPNAIYARAPIDATLKRAMPQAFAEGVELAQLLAGSSSPKAVTE